MGRVLTNNVSLAYAIEDSIGVLPGSPTWKKLEPNTIANYGSTITTVARSPITADRQRRKGTITDLDSAAEFEVDFTLDALVDFIEGFCFARFSRNATYGSMVKHPTAATTGGSGGYTVPGTDSDSDVDVVASTTANGTLASAYANASTIDGVVLATGQLILLKNQTTATENGLYTVNASGAPTRSPSYDSDGELRGVRVRIIGGSTLAGHVFINTNATAITVGVTNITFAEAGIPEGALVFARGFSSSTNNGLKSVASGSTSVNVRVNSLAAETVASTANATVEVAGVQGAASDITMNSGGNLVSSTLDFRTLGLLPGQFVKVGGSEVATQFGNVPVNNGYARVVLVAQNLLTLDKRSGAFATDNGSGKTIQILFGRFCRNVASTADEDFLERYFQFELGMPNLGAAGVEGYEYCIGNLCNQLTFDLPLANKATVSPAFIGKDTEPVTVSRKTNASTPLDVTMGDVFNTTPDVARLRITELDEGGLSTDFKSVSLVLNNNVSPEKVIGTLGAKYMNTGTFEVNLEARLLFTEADVPDAIRQNRTVTMDTILRNEDGGVAVDIPSMTLGGGAKEFPINESVAINVTGQAVRDATLDTSVGFSVFPYLPSS